MNDIISVSRKALRAELSGAMRQPLHAKLSDALTQSDKIIDTLVADAPQREPNLHPTEIPSLTPDQKGILEFAMTMMNSGYPREILRSWINESPQPGRFEVHASTVVDHRCLCGVEYVSHPDESDVFNFLRNQTEIACPYFREYCQWLAIADICNTSFRSFEAGWRRMLHFSRFSSSEVVAQNP